MPGEADQLPKAASAKPTLAHGSPNGFAASNASRNYQVALQHANLIQARKDVESLILEALEELMEFPTSPNASPSAPLAADVDRFRTLIRPFQSSDYDELFEERNLIDKCAYVFCPRKRRHEPHRGPLRLTRGDARGSGYHILEAKKTEMWCSKECARRALYIKVQLGETPAWERLGGLTRPIEILDESGQNELEEKMATLGVAGSADSDLEKALGRLALERGEKTAAIGSSRMAAAMQGSLVEKDTSRQPRPPSGSGGEGGEIEGYQPQIAPSRRT